MSQGPLSGFFKTFENDGQPQPSKLTISGPKMCIFISQYLL